MVWAAAETNGTALAGASTRHAKDARKISARPPRTLADPHPTTKMPQQNQKFPQTAQRHQDNRR
jgi:hypothetical protein